MAKQPPFHRMLVCIGGLSASGKTTTAHKLTASLNLPKTSVIDPDQVFHEVTGSPNTEAGSRSARDNLYIPLVAMLAASRIVKAMHETGIAIVPYLFTNKATRALVGALCKIDGADLRGAWLMAPREVTAARAEQRAQDWANGCSSPINFSTAKGNKRDPIAVARAVPESWTRIDTTETKDDVMRKVRAAVIPDAWQAANAARLAILHRPDVTCGPKNSL